MPVPSKIYALADDNSIVYSNDAGSTWLNSSSPVDPSLFDIAANPYDPMVILAAGLNGIYISLDGGISWNISTGPYSSIATSSRFKRIFFLDGFTVFAISNTHVVKSTDGGLTFGVIAVVNDLYPGQNGESIYFSNSLLGVISIYDKYFTTIDGGTTWDVANSGSPLVPGEIIYSVSATSNFSSILATTTSKVWVSPDGGVNNTDYLTFSGAATYQNYIYNYNDDNIYVLAPYSGSVYKTIDQGLSWAGNSGLFVAGGTGTINKFIVLSNELAYFTPNKSNIYISTDDGTSLTVSKSGKYISITGLLTQCNECPEGFTLVNGICEKITYTDPVYTGGLLEVVNGSVNAAYGKFGLNLMPDITNMVLPIKGSGASNLLYSFKESNGLGLVVNAIPGYSPGNYAGISAVNSNLWGSLIPGCATGAAGGRLNLTSVWAPGVLPNEEVSFTFCINLEESKQYLIGIAGDNSVKFYVDDNLYVHIESTDPGVTTPFNYWHVFPITLSAGNHIIKLSGINLGGDAGFGAEIYDIDLATFQSTLCNTVVANPNCGNVPADLEPYIVFSTKNLPGTHSNPGQTFVPDPEDPGEYLCPDGATLDYCSGVVKCEVRTYAPYYQCCYKLFDCNSVRADIYTNTNLSAFIGKVIQIADYPDDCWQLEVTDEYCLNPVSVAVTKEFVDCQSCVKSYKLYNCLDPEIVLYTTQASFEQYTNPSEVVVLDEFLNSCWQVGVNYDTSFVPGTYTVVDAMTTCSQCVPTYFELVSCVTSEIIYAYPDLDNVLLNNDGKVVKLDIEGEILCYAVTKLTGWGSNLVDVTVVEGGYIDCECCLPQPTPEPEVFVRTIQDPVKIFYRVEEDSCAVRINCKFAENYYRLYQGLQYGVGNCCNTIDFDKLWIQKELCDYSSILDEGACIAPVVVVEEECEIATIVTCDKPIDVSASGSLI